MQPFSEFLVSWSPTLKIRVLNGHVSELQNNQQKDTGHDNKS